MRALWPYLKTGENPMAAGPRRGQSYCKDRTLGALRLKRLISIQSEPFAASISNSLQVQSLADISPVEGKLKSYLPWRNSCSVYLTLPLLTRPYLSPLPGCHTTGYCPTRVMRHRCVRELYLDGAIMGWEPCSGRHITLSDPPTNLPPGPSALSSRPLSRLGY